MSLLALTITALLAGLTHALIEEPGMALGRKVARTVRAPAGKSPHFVPAVVTGIVAVPTETQTLGSA